MKVALLCADGHEDQPQGQEPFIQLWQMAGEHEDPHSDQSPDLVHLKGKLMEQNK